MAVTHWSIIPRRVPLAFAGAHIFREFQVFTAHLVNHQKTVQRVGLDAAEMFRLLLLGFTHIGQQCTGGADSRGGIFTSKAFQAAGLKLFDQDFTAGLGIEFLVRQERRSAFPQRPGAVLNDFHCPAGIPAAGFHWVQCAATHQ